MIARDTRIRFRQLIAIARRGTLAQPCLADKKAAQQCTKSRSVTIKVRDLKPQKMLTFFSLTSARSQRLRGSNRCLPVRLAFSAVAGPAFSLSRSSASSKIKSNSSNTSSLTTTVPVFRTCASSARCICNRPRRSTSPSEADCRASSSKTIGSDKARNQGHARAKYVSADSSGSSRPLLLDLVVPGLPLALRHPGMLQHLCVCVCV